MKKLLIGALLITGGCTADPQLTPEAIPAFPEGEIGHYNGSFSTRTESALAKAKKDLEDTYGPFTFEPRYEILLDSAATWEDVRTFYETSFAKAPLNAFSRTDAVSLHPNTYQIAIWKSDDEALGVAMVPDSSAEHIQFVFFLGSRRADATSRIPMAPAQLPDSVSGDSLPVR